MRNIIILISTLFFSFYAYSQDKIKEIEDGYTGFFQKVKIDNKRYKKIKLRGEAKVTTFTDLGGVHAFFLMQGLDSDEKLIKTSKVTRDQLVTENKWVTRSVEIEVDNKINILSVGGLVEGDGEFYFDGFYLEGLDKQGKWEEIELTNGSFESDIEWDNDQSWVEGFNLVKHRSKYYSFKKANNFKEKGGNFVLKIIGKTPEIKLVSDLKIESTKLNKNKEAILIKNIQLIDVVKGTLKTQDVLIENEKIKLIRKKIKEKKDYVVINGKGKWLLPGMIDSHIHLFQSGGLYTRPDALNLTKYRSYEEEREWLKRYAPDFLKRYLRCGITTVIDVGGPMYNFDLRDKYSDITEYPNILLTGPLVSTYQPKAFEIENAPIIKAKTPKEARSLVKEQIAFKPDFIKIWYIVRSSKDEEKNYNIVKATIEEAHKNNLKVAVHATQLKTAKKAIKAGADFLVHSVEDEELDDEFIKMVKEGNVSYIPTLIVGDNYRRAYTSDLTPSKNDFSISNPTALGSLYDTRKFEMKSLPIWKRYKTFFDSNKEERRAEEKRMANNLKKAVESGFNVATGTDAGNIGTLHATSYSDELKAMKKAGLTNLQILKASTINGAKILGKENILGSIDEGKMADLIILTANPLEDIQAVEKIAYVIKGGSAFPINKIIEDSPEQLVQRQVNGYNARDIEAFLEPYSENFEIYDFPNELRKKGKKNIRDGYVELFKKYTKLHCEVVKRIVLKNKVIDHERITGISKKPIEAIAIYEIKNGKINKVTFVN